MGTLINCGEKGSERKGTNWRTVAGGEASRRGGRWQAGKQNDAVLASVSAEHKSAVTPSPAGSTSRR